MKDTVEQKVQPAAATRTSRRVWPRVVFALAVGFLVGRVCDDADYVYIFRDESPGEVTGIFRDESPGGTTCDASGLPPLPPLLDSRSRVYDELSPAETRAVDAVAGVCVILSVISGEAFQGFFLCAAN